MKTILIISHTQDYHVEKVLDILNENQTNYFALNLDRFPKQYLLNQTFSNGSLYSTLEDTVTKQRLTLSNVGAIWLRKPADFSYQQTDMDGSTLKFANQETEHALFSALYDLDCFWLSHPKYLRASMWKGEQLKRAARLGFNIPDTLISNDPDKIRSFYLKHQNVVYKVMSDPVITQDNLPSQGVATTLIDEDMLEDTDSLQLLPNQFQAYVDKAYELRVTIIAGKIFTAKIDSQIYPETQIDCRNLNVQVPMSVYQLPEKIAHLCLRFIESYSLNYSAIDIIVTPENDYVFLENNPNGQFMFIEENVPELEIANALVDTLEKACK